MCTERQCVLHTFYFMPHILVSFSFLRTFVGISQLVECVSSRDRPARKHHVALARHAELIHRGGIQRAGSSALNDAGAHVNDSLGGRVVDGGRRCRVYNWWRGSWADGRGIRHGQGNAGRGAHWVEPKPEYW